MRRPLLERHVHTMAAGVPVTWGIAVETPVEIGINSSPWAVMMATPADLEDLAVGLALTERFIVDSQAIERVEVSNYLDGIAVDVIVPAAAVNNSARRRRSLEGRIGCGLCGVEALAGLPQRPNGVVGPRIDIAESAVRSAFDALASLQPLNRATHSVHAAAWCHTDGEIDLVREDVGRHNALDKVIGALARNQRLDQPGFIVMTSRCSFELVYKAAATRAGVLATISAPTSLALEWSTLLGLPLLCLGPDRTIVGFTTDPSHAA
jgi:FdhD protein